MSSITPGPLAGETRTRAMQGTRRAWVDVTRGLAICLVVLGHVIQFSAGTRFDFFSNPAFVIIYAFHMPLFIAISGFLAAGSVNRYAGVILLRQRVRSLLVPFAVWTVIGNGLLTTVTTLAAHTFSPFLLVKTIAAEFVFPEESLWFLWVLFACTGLLVVSRAMARRLGWTAYLVLFVVVLLIPADRVLAGAQVKWLYPFFLAGYLVHLHGAKLVRYERILVIGSTFAFTGLLFLWQRNDSIYLSRMNLIPGGPASTLAMDLYRTILAVAGVITVVGIARLIGRRLTLGWLQRLGVASLGIYAMEGYFLIWLEPFSLLVKAPVVYALFVVVTTVVIVALTYVITVLAWERWRITRVLLLGGR